MRVAEIALPNYTKFQEIWNSISHGVGVLFSLIAGPFIITKAARLNDNLAVMAVSIYIVSMIILYAGSALYHALDRNNGKRVLRVLDHNNVFLLVMGSYLPFCWISLRQYQSPFPWGWVIFSIVWGFSIVGIILNSIDIWKFRVFCAIVQILVASSICAAIYPLYCVIGLQGVLCLLGSGVLYWIGAILYGLGAKKSEWFHTVFHFFILFGTILMYFTIYFFVL